MASVPLVSSGKLANQSQCCLTGHVRVGPSNYTLDGESRSQQEVALTAVYLGMPTAQIRHSEYTQPYSVGGSSHADSGYKYHSKHFCSPQHYHQQPLAYSLTISGP